MHKRKLVRHICKHQHACGYHYRYQSTSSSSSTWFSPFSLLSSLSPSSSSILNSAAASLSNTLHQTLTDNMQLQSPCEKIQIQPSTSTTSMPSTSQYITIDTQQANI